MARSSRLPSSLVLESRNTLPVSPVWAVTKMALLHPEEHAAYGIGLRADASCMKAHLVKGYVLRLFLS